MIKFKTKVEKRKEKNDETIGETIMSKGDDLRKNASGYFDPTAYEAIKHVDEEDKRFHELLRTIHYICEMAEFKIDGRIVLKDLKTGRIWR